MSYVVVYTPESQDQLSRLPVPVALLLVDEIDRQSAHPTANSFPALQPFPLAQHLFAELLAADQHWHFVVYFVYGSDEQTLFVIGIGWW